MEVQKDLIKHLMAENGEKWSKGTGEISMGMLGKRESSSLEINDPSMNSLTMKHLIFFLENDPTYRKSKLLFKALMARSSN